MRYSLAVQWNKINSDRMRRNRNSPHRDRVINATMKFIPSTALYFSFLSQNYDSYLWLIRFLGTGMVRRTPISPKLTKKREIVKHTVWHEYFTNDHAIIIRCEFILELLQLCHVFVLFTTTSVMTFLCQL